MRSSINTRVKLYRSRGHGSICFRPTVVSVGGLLIMCACKRISPCSTSTHFLNQINIHPKPVKETSSASMMPATAGTLPSYIAVPRMYEAILDPNDGHIVISFDSDTNGELLCRSARLCNDVLTDDCVSIRELCLSQQVLVAYTPIESCPDPTFL
jgi:hypothetical protein